MPSVNGGTAGGSPPGLDRDDLIRAGKLAALGELTPGVAHEVNNPLFAVLGLVELLLADAEPGSAAHRRLTVVRDTALELRGVLRALLAFARERGDTRTIVDVAETVRGAVELVRRTSSARDVEIVEALPAEPVRVVGSRNQIGQVAVHLVANACAVVESGGTVTVALDRDGEWATVTVADSGPGVAPELRERIFEPFFTTRPGGSGLGLAAGRAIADGHGGSLELASDGPGASFVLRLPIAGRQS